MSTTRFTTALLAAAMLTTVSTAPTAAKRPTAPPPPPEERPLTADEEAASAAKIAAAEAYLESVGTGSVGTDSSELSPLSCLAPNHASTDAAASTDATPSYYCKVPSAALPVYARDQARAHYCGPAVGQVIANYAWGVSSRSNKYSQATIARWMQTDARGYTNAPELEYGLEVATRGAPRRPANWDWVVSPLTDTNRNGTVADQLHGYVKSNVSYSRMPLAIPVKPYAIGSRYHLSSWSKPVNSVGHWIAAYGWYANWTNSDTPRIYYTDSSRDEGGSTGKFWDPTRHLAAMIMEHTRRFVW